MTNREWMESLTDYQLADFLTVGLSVICKSFPQAKCMYYTNIDTIARYCAENSIGIIQWLYEEQEFEVRE